MKKMVEALAQKTCAGEKDYGDGKLDDHKAGSETAPEAAGGGASAFASPSESVMERLSRRSSAMRRGGKRGNAPATRRGGS